MDLIQNQTRIARSGRSRRLEQMKDSERFQVSCAKCGRSFVYGPTELRHYPQEVPLSHYEQTMPPKCWGFMGKQPDDCPREVTWLDVSPEDGGCSDEG